MVFGPVVLAALLGAVTASDMPSPAAEGRFSATNASPVSESRPRPKVAASVPAATVVADVCAVETSVPVSVVVPAVSATELQKAVSLAVADVLRAALAGANDVKVPEYLVADIADVTSTTISDVLAAVCSQMAELVVADQKAIELEPDAKAAVSALVAAIYAKLVALSVPGVQPAEIVKIQTEWYERFHAANGSRMYWILKLAREKAARGESVESLKKAFDTSMSRDLTQDEDLFKFLHPTKKDPE